METVTFSDRIFKMQEAHLLRLIRQRMPKPFRDRYNFLFDKLQDETLSELEHEELLQLTHKLEERQLEYLQQLIELSKLNGISLPEVMEKYHIRPRKKL
ncbi:MAG: hypothetical protein MUC59_03245 [Saprospiraceae bacterium]|jgi:hypothetical protein|nr:hypothetical protein [Saprospiraceae bacterium]